MLALKFFLTYFILFVFGCVTLWYFSDEYEPRWLVTLIPRWSFVVGFVGMLVSATIWVWTAL